MTDTVGGNLQAIFKKGHGPADNDGGHNGHGLMPQMPIPGIGHEAVGTDKQQNRDERNREVQEHDIAPVKVCAAYTMPQRLKNARLNHAGADAVLPTTNQRQGGVIYQNGMERMGIRRNVCPLMEKDSLSAYMNVSWQKSSSVQAQRVKVLL